MNMEKEEWPEIESQRSFDWSLSQREIEKLYPVKRTKPQEAYTPEEEDRDIVALEYGSEEFVKLLQRKYPYVFECLLNISPDMPRWVYDNLIAKQLKHKR